MTGFWIFAGWVMASVLVPIGIWTAAAVASRRSARRSLVPPPWPAPRPPVEPPVDTRPGHLDMDEFEDALLLPDADPRKDWP